MKDPTLFASSLLAWFDHHGRKDLPWQQDKTPYRVWISEIMLQQTQVKTVIPYYLRFMERFPTVSILAQANADDVLHHWSGLGYYSRARNLHKASKKIMLDFAGQFPNTLLTLQSLPGIGRSTAGAIMAIAYRQSTPILDGNVKRVLARFHGIQDVLSEKAVENQLWDHAISYLPQDRADDYTQAMMDLGATVCTRTKPQCLACPLHSNCQAHLQQISHLIPKKKTAKVLPVKSSTFVIIKNHRCVLLKKRGQQGIWGGLWSFPEIIGIATDQEIHDYYYQQFHSNLVHLTKLPAFRHTFSHYHLDIHPVLIELAQAPRRVMEQNEQIWYNLAQPAPIGIPKPVAHIMKELTID